MQKIGRVPRVEFLRVAEEVMARFLALPENPKPERTGGFMAVLDQSSGEPKMLFVNELGICQEDLALRCFDYCQEKVRRLAIWQASGHLSGWQSRVPGIHEYGGAVAAPPSPAYKAHGMKDGRKLIGAVSGLVEHGDEAVSLVLWVSFRWLTYSEAQDIAKISENPFFEPLMIACRSIFDTLPLNYE